MSIRHSQRDLKLDLGQNRKFEELFGQGAWVAQSVKHQTLDLRSGHDLTVCELSPMSVSAGILSLLLFALPCLFSLSQ